MDEATEKRWSNWSVRDGYLEVARLPVINKGDDVEEILKNETLPRRVISAGLHAGLTVVLNVDKEEYFCSGSESIAFKVSKIRVP